MNIVTLGPKEFKHDLYSCTKCKTEYLELHKNCSVCGGKCEIHHIYNCHIPHWGQHQIVVLEEIK